MLLHALLHPDEISVGSNERSGSSSTRDAADGIKSGDGKLPDLMPVG